MQHGRTAFYASLLQTLSAADLGIVLLDKSRRVLYANHSAHSRVATERVDGNDLFIRLDLPPSRLPFAIGLVMDGPEWSVDGATTLGRQDLEEMNTSPRHLGSDLVLLVFAANHCSGGLVERVRSACGLTERQAQVVEGVCAGLTNKEIAKRLWISEVTVKKHLVNIGEALGVHNRTSLVHEVLTRLGVFDSVGERLLLP